MIALLFLFWIKLTWASPGDSKPDGTLAKCVAMECQRWNAGDNWYPTLLRRDSTQSSPLCVPANPGAPDSGYVDVPSTETEWRRGGMALHIRAQDAAGNWSNWSNRTVG